MKIGSLFSGGGGLDMAVEAVFGAETVWHCEVDSAASKVLAARWPDVPNLLDITEVNWSNWKPLLEVDILCGGYPCQPFSAAGQRKGASDERHLWPYFAEAIRVLRPRFVVLENVAGHRSMGFDRVLADLAEIGYDAQWCSVRASDIGAPHRRERLFVVAHPDNRTRHGQRACQEPGQRNSATPDTCSDRRERCEERNLGTQRPGLQASQRHNLDRCGLGNERSTAAVSGNGPVNLIPTPRASDAGPRGGTTGFGLRNWTRDYIAELLPTPCARDFKDATASPGAVSRNTPSRGAIDYYLPTPNVSDTKTPQDVVKRLNGGHQINLADAAITPSQWGKYESAIRRWEAVLGRPAPSPTEPNRNGNPRLNPEFSSWMMGWPAGWVTDVDGISRNDALRIIGNGVCVQQCVAALRWLLSVCEVAA